MNKTKISAACAAILSTVSAPLMAEASLEEQLNAAANGLEDISIDELLEGEDISIMILDSDDVIETMPMNEEQQTVVATIEKEVEKEVVEIEKSIAKELEKELGNSIAKVDSKSYSEDEDLSFDLTDSDQVEVNSEDLVFLRYIPEGTRFTINKTFNILPKKKYIILHEGERVLKNPQSKADPEKTFCYIELKSSGKARVLRSGKQFSVTSTTSTLNDEKIKKSYGSYILRTQKTDFKVDNKNVKSISCVSANMFKESEKAPTPLMIKDMKQQTGGIFKVDYPAYEEI